MAKPVAPETEAVGFEGFPAGTTHRKMGNGYQAPLGLLTAFNFLGKEKTER